jgi:2-amino-4-hydroxy-6-hydroxymethyldihydropteridine diphosphokinase
MPWIWVSVGSNMDREANIKAGIHALSERFGELQLSPVYETEAVGFAGNAFLNMVLGFDAELPLKDVRRMLRDIEHAQGRIRDGQKFGSRTLDLDILTYGDLVDESQDIPRAEIMRYAFVLAPLADVAPQQLHPGLGKTYARLWQDFSGGKAGMRQLEPPGLS